MLVLGLAIGFSVGVAAMSIYSQVSPVGMECKRLDREIAADNLKCAQEERRAAALRVIAMNETQARRWSER